MRNLDFSTWDGIATTLIGLALVTLVGMGIRLLMMVTIQQRRERMNRQINERLRTLIAAYKTLGGSFTGELTVDPTHLRQVQDAADALSASTDRSRRIRDAVETALSDIILLGTEEQVRLAQHAARELVAGRAVHTHDLVVSLRSFIREALDLDPIPAGLDMPMQGPARPASGGGRERNDRGGKSGGGGQAGMGMGMGGDGLGPAAGDDGGVPR